MGKETISRTTFAKGVTAGVIAAASLGILTVGEYALDATPTDESAVSAPSLESTDTGAASQNDTEGAAADLSSCAPGVYTASAKGISSDVTVTVTFDESGITDITADVSGETPDIGGVIGDEMIEKVLSAQSAAVDGVSGATITSDAFKAAVADCIAQASGSGAGGEADTPSEETEVTENVSEAGTEAAVNGAEADTEAAENASESDTEAAVEAVAVSANSDVPAEGLNPGTYTASAKGISSDVTVTATFDENGITALSADVSGETPDIGGLIGDEMIEKVLNAQSAAVDGVAGATITSDAFKAAVEDCIALASGGASPAATDAATADEVETDAAAETAEAETGDTAETAEAETDDTAEAAEAETDATAEASEAETGDAEAPVENTGTANADREYIPGAYSASAKGISSDVEVVAVFDETGITSLYTDVSGETPDIGGLIGDEMIEKALSAQSADIDGVSGATITSDAFKAALSSCIDMASSGNAVAETDDSEAETVAVISEADGPTATFVAGKASVEEASASYLTKETEAGPEESPEGPFVPGTYTASAAGIDSDVTVTMTFDETSILSIDVDVSGETAGIGAMIGDDMVGQLLNAQSADVDGVSGATITSDAVKTAAADCISQARSGSTAEAAADAEAVPAMETESELK